jgi:spoIIIJ-associated protein
VEWVETVARTVDEAKELALDQLGVAEDDAEFEVLEEPKPGLFGRMRGEARVRARVRPTAPRPKVERRDRRRRNRDDSSRADGGRVDGDGQETEAAVVVAAASASVEGYGDEPASPSDRPPRGSSDRSGGGNGGSSGRGGNGGGSGNGGKSRDRGGRDERPADDDRPPVDPAQVGAEAERFLSGLVGAFGLTGTTTLHREGDDLEVKVDGDDLGLLIGPRGATLQAIQDVARVASQRRLGDHDTHLRIDVGAYRERRRAALARFATQLAEQVKETGSRKVLEPMPSSDRKVVHDTLMEIDGVASHSEGDEPFRRVVITPAED